jgi:hypothetical protein
MELIARNTEVFEVPGGGWVELRTRIGGWERSKIRSAAIAIQLGDGKAEAGVDYAATVQAGLEVGIVGWSLAVPVTPANIQLLDEAAYEWISTKLNELWTPRKDDERGNSEGPGPTPLPVVESSPPNSGG